MKCHDARRRMDLFHDGELDVKENMEVLQHLNLCVACSKIYEGEKELRSLLKEGLSVEAPDGMWDRFKAELRPRFSWRIPAAVAAVMVVTISILLFLPSGSGSDLQAVAVAAVEVHETKKVGLCTQHNTRQDLMAHYERETGYQPCLHDLSSSEISWEYASTTDKVIRGKMVCWMTLKDGKTGKTVSQVSFPADMLSKLEGGETVGSFRMLKYKGRVVVVANCGKRICVFVADDEPEAERVMVALGGAQ